jgi:RNA polymerase sigma factor (sigma-70 family)
MRTELDAGNTIVRAQQGDERAFAELRLAYDRAVRGYVWTRVYHKADVEDVQADAWELIWRKLATYDPALASFGTWARTWADFAVRRYGGRRKQRLAETPYPSRASRSGAEETEEEEPGARQIPRGVRNAPWEHEDTVAEAATSREVFDELLRLTFATRSPPHQLVAFGFCKLLEWKPQQLMDELSDVPLRSLVLRLEAEYLAQSQLTPAEVEPNLRPLRANLERAFELVVQERKTLETYPRLHQRVVGETTLRDYYTGEDPTTDITQWWYAVKRRVLSEFRQRGNAAPAERAGGP